MSGKMKTLKPVDEVWMQPKPQHPLLSETAKTWFERVLSFPMVIAAAFATLVYFMAPTSMADPDIWWHLRNAESLFSSHKFITVDSYSFSAAGAPWINHEWLAEIPFYLGWQVMGERGVVLVTLSGIESVMLGIFYLTYRRSRNLKTTALFSSIAALLATVSFGPRTLLFGWLCLLIELVVLERFRTQQRVIWTLPVLFAVWVNVHGSWLIGMVLLYLFAVCGRVRIHTGTVDNSPWTRSQFQELLTATGLSTVALLINPYGWRLVAYPFNLAFHQRLNIANVEEWGPLDLHSPRGRLFLLCVVTLFLGQLICRRCWRLDELVFLLVGVYSAFAYSRFLFLAAILVMPLMSEKIFELRPSQVRRTRPWLNAMLLLPLMLLAASHTLATATNHDADAKYPLRALSFLRDFHPRGNVFNEYIWGGYLEWHTRQVPVMIDSRVDIFEYNGTFKDYLDVVAIKRTTEILDKYKIGYVFFERESPLVSFLMQTSAWKVDYDDGSAILLERTLPQDDWL